MDDIETFVTSGAFASCIERPPGDFVNYINHGVLTTAYRHQRPITLLRDGWVIFHGYPCPILLNGDTIDDQDVSQWVRALHEESFHRPVACAPHPWSLGFGFETLEDGSWNVLTQRPPIFP